MHLPFSKWVDKQMFSYLFCGALGSAIDILLFSLLFHLFNGLEINIWGIKPYILAFLVAFIINFPIGYLLSKYIVFNNKSTIRSQAQLFRYSMLVAMCFCLNYIILRFFIEFCGLYPTFAKIFTTIIVAGFSYFYQKHIAFVSKPSHTS